MFQACLQQFLTSVPKTFSDSVLAEINKASSGLINFFDQQFDNTLELFLSHMTLLQSEVRASSWRRRPDELDGAISAASRLGKSHHILYPPCKIPTRGTMFEDKWIIPHHCAMIQIGSV